MIHKLLHVDHKPGNPDVQMYIKSIIFIFKLPVKYLNQIITLNTQSFFINWIQQLILIVKLLTSDTKCNIYLDFTNNSVTFGRDFYHKSLDHVYLSGPFHSYIFQLVNHTITNIIQYKILISV